MLFVYTCEAVRLRATPYPYCLCNKRCKRKKPDSLEGGVVTIGLMLKRDSLYPLRRAYKRNLPLSVALSVEQQLQ